MDLSKDPVTAVWIELIVTFPDLELFVHYPDAVVLKVALDAVAEVNNSLVSLQIQLDLVLQSQGIH